MIRQLLEADFPADYPGPYDRFGGNDPDNLLKEDDLRAWASQFKNLRDLTVELASGSDEIVSDDTLNDFLPCLESREKANLPRLQSLAIRDCDIARQTVQGLEKLVDRVVWDKKETGQQDFYCIRIERNRHYREQQRLLAETGGEE